MEETSFPAQFVVNARFLVFSFGLPSIAGQTRAAMDLSSLPEKLFRPEDAWSALLPAYTLAMQCSLLR